MGFDIIKAVTLCCLVGYLSNGALGLPSQNKNVFQMLTQGDPEELIDEEPDRFSRMKVLSNRALIAQEQLPYGDWLEDLLGSGNELVKHFKGLVPYLTKSLKPLIAILIQILEKAKVIIIEYFKNISPETLGNIQKSLVGLVGKVINYHSLKLIIKVLFNSLI